MRESNMACFMLLILASASRGGEGLVAEAIETDSESGVQVYLLGADDRHTDNIYCEQPYNDQSGRWIAIRYFPKRDQQGGISILDLNNGSRRDVFTGDPHFPAFHAWGSHLYFQQTIDDTLLLRRCRYDTMEIEDVAPLPAEMGSFSYGTISQDLRYYAVCVKEQQADRSKVHLLDLQAGQWRLLLDKPSYHAKHEQFSRDGRNRILIQLNKLPDVKQVLLGELTVDGEELLFPADHPHTPRPTGHEAWIGTTNKIFFSTGYDAARKGNSWTAGIGDDHPVLVASNTPSFAHVSVSKCGRYWICDAIEKDIPIYVGKFGSGAYKRLVLSRTTMDKNQWSHAHPYMTADNQWVIFNSTRSGHAQVYGAKLKQGWLDSL